MENLRSSGIECEPRPGCGSRNGCPLCGRSGVLLSGGPLPVGRVRCTSAGSTRTIETFSPGSIPSGRSRRARKCPHLQLPGGVGADDLHRGTVVVAEPDRVAAAEESQPKSATNPWSSSTSAPTLTHRTIGVGGAAVGEPADGASRGAPARPRRQATSAGAGDPRRCDRRTPEIRERRRPVRASISPFLISHGGLCKILLEEVEPNCGAK